MCCKAPCLVAHWVGKVYGYLCTNCCTFTPA